MPELTKEQMEQVEQYLASLPEAEREAKREEIMSQLENQTPQCPFCLMNEGKIKTTNIYSDDNFMAVLEINPANPGHTILFPKRHIKSSSELNDQEVESLGKILKNLTTAVSSISGSVNIIDSEGPDSGNKFDHMTINLIPRVQGDSVQIVWQPKKAEEKELEEVQQKLIQNIPKEEVKEEPVDEDELKKEFYKTKKRLP